jgi:hypothetical protein
MNTWAVVGVAMVIPLTSEGRGSPQSYGDDGRSHGDSRHAVTSFSPDDPADELRYPSDELRHPIPGAVRTP